ncbi:predicted protein [Uncinocarpus reesii 1704]|uniref:DUF7708 domain-containing protein n=1 Tax=Uncinocarpus reesii (strain UAMH 1704) TaxID=336963 RepID=C4JQI1_UNCRE|nr:uncharacterized protein UREG_03326 [Uncinocarpus reesii 1704]EEP78480.1 predicted protein [Uncinocarpus reesii 1704]
MTRSMPRFEDYLRYFPTNDRLHLHLVNIYETFILFCAKAFKFLNSRRITVVVWATWRSLHKTFEDAVQRVSSDKEDLEHEARAANIEVGFVREQAAEKRHQAVMAIIPTALKTAKLIKPTFIVPEARNDSFIGREVELASIHQHLIESRKAGEINLRTVTIRGFGGMGKTQLALEYAFKNRKVYKGVFWLRAENTTIMQHDFAQIGRLLDENTTGMDLNKTVQAAKDWLLATSQCKIELEGFQPAEATKLLTQIYPQVPETDKTREVLSELGGMPLGICQMGIFMRQTKCTMDQFSTILQTNSERFYSDTASMAGSQYVNTLATCCDLSIGLLSEKETYLMGVMAFFQTDKVQESLITGGCQDNPRLKHLADIFDWNDEIRILAKHDLVTPIHVDSGRNLRMHRIVKRRAIHVLEPPKRLEAFQDAVDLLNRTFPARPPNGGTMCKDWADCELWIPHVLSLKTTFGWSGLCEQDVPRAYIEMLCNCAWYMWERGTEHALEFATHTLDISEKVLGKDAPDALQSDILTIVGALKLPTYQTREECVELFQRALNVRQKYMAAKTNPSHDDQRMLANCYSNTGAGRLVLEEYNEAMPLFQKALDIKYTLGDETTIPYDIGVTLYNICRVQMGQGRVAEAKTTAKKVIDLVETHNGPDDFRSNQFRFTYADLLVACGEVDKGLEVHERTLAIRNRAMGEGHNDSGVSHYGLSCVYQQLGRLADALESVGRAITIFHSVPGAEDRVARSYFRKHLILKEMQQDGEAKKALVEAQNYRKALVGHGQAGTDSMADYDSLVSYYNK